MLSSAVFGLSVRKQEQKSATFFLSIAHIFRNFVCLRVDFGHFSLPRPIREGGIFGRFGKLYKPAKIPKKIEGEFSGGSLRPRERFCVVSESYAYKKRGHADKRSTDNTWLGKKKQILSKTLIETLTKNKTIFSLLQRED